MVATLVQQDPLPKGRTIGENDSILRDYDKDLDDDYFKVSRFIITYIHSPLYLQRPTA